MLRRFFSVFLIFVLCISFAVSAFAEPVEKVEQVELTYWEWCMYYSLCPCDDHNTEYIGIKSYSAGRDEFHPVFVSYFDYEQAFPGRVENPSERNFEIATELAGVGDKENADKYIDSSDFASLYGNLNLGSILTDYISKEAIANIAAAREADALAEDAESSHEQVASLTDGSSNVSLLSANPVPDSGSAYSKPVLVATEYVADADAGSLLSVLYSLLGKPVKSYTYSYVNSYSSSQQTVYKLELLDYDINWLASFFMLCLVVYCVFKAGGALLSKL